MLWGLRVDCGPRLLLPRARTRASTPLIDLLQWSAWLFVQGACARLGRLDADLLVACQPTEFLLLMINAYASGAYLPSAACSPHCLKRRLVEACVPAESSSDPCLARLDVIVHMLPRLLRCLRRAARRWRCTRASACAVSRGRC